MSSDSLLLRELKGLREEISATQKERPAQAAERNATEDKAADVPIEAIASGRCRSGQGQRHDR